jgi:hypothetical protein
MSNRLDGPALTFFLLMAEHEVGADAQPVIRPLVDCAVLLLVRGHPMGAGMAVAAVMICAEWSEAGKRPASAEATLGAAVVALATMSDDDHASVATVRQCFAESDPEALACVL